MILQLLLVLCVFSPSSACDYASSVGVLATVMLAMRSYAYVVLKPSLKLNGIEKLRTD